MDNLLARLSRRICSALLKASVLVGSLLAMICLSLPAPAYAQTFQIDLYVSVQSTPGEPLMGGFYEGGSVAVPKDAIGPDGTVPFDSKFEGADGLRQALDKAFARANAKFKAAGVQFTIRKVIFVPSDHPKLSPHYIAESDEYRFDLDSEGRSTLLRDFADMTKETKDAFTMLIAPISLEQVDPRTNQPIVELGRGQNSGTVSIVNTGTALLDFDNGSIIIHELGHNLGITEHTDDPINEAMAERTVTDGRQPDPKLTPEQIAIIQREVKTGRYDAMRVDAPPKSAGTSATAPKSVTKTKAGVKGATKSQSTKTGVKKQTAKSKSKQQPASRDSTGELLQLGIGVGSGFIGGSRNRGDRQHQRGKQH